MTDLTLYFQEGCGGNLNFELEKLLSRYLENKNAENSTDNGGLPSGVSQGGFESLFRILSGPFDILN